MKNNDRKYTINDVKQRMPDMYEHIKNNGLEHLYKDAGIEPEESLGDKIEAGDGPCPDPDKKQS